MLDIGLEKWTREWESKYGKYDPLKIFYISTYEARMINNWIAKNQHTLSSGYFELRLHFGKFLIPAELMYHHKGEVYSLPDDDGYNSREDISTPVGQIPIDGVIVDLKLSAETIEKYFQVEEKYIHVERGKPYDFRLRFEIHKKICNIFAGEGLIETRDF